MRRNGILAGALLAVAGQLAARLDALFRGWTAASFRRPRASPRECSQGF